MPLDQPGPAIGSVNVSSFLVRAAGLGDLDELVALFAQLDEHEQGWRIFRSREDVLDETKARYPRFVTGEGRIVVAEAAGRIVGLGVARVTKPSSYSDEEALELSNLLVVPAFRRGG